MKPEIVDAFAAIVGPENLLTDREDILPYGFDGTASIREMPAAVVFPKDKTEVAACVRVAARHGIPVIGRGSGTGLSGGSVPVPGGIVLCLVRLDAILGVDARNLTLRAQAGVIGARDLHGRACSGNIQSRLPPPPRRRPQGGGSRNRNHPTRHLAGPGLSQRMPSCPCSGTSSTQCPDSVRILRNLEIPIPAGRCYRGSFL